MAGKVTEVSAVRHPRLWLWCLVVVGASAGALLGLSDAAVRVERSKLGAASSWECRVRVLGLPVYRTRVTGSAGEVQSLMQALGRAGHWGLATVLGLVGGGVGAAVAAAGRGLSKR
jgi:hypothetical protein